ncbi:MAG: hypothetical protein BVN35_20005 [Proteobacteria bacterium ST_bin11]|nr:MAG: hypothetical protein BVN35_20005 [Proteobacteria bacterium ST_bin11]
MAINFLIVSMVKIDNCKDYPLVQVDEQKTIVKGIDSLHAKPIFVFDTTLKTLSLYLVKELDYTWFLGLLAQRYSGETSMISSSSEIFLCRQSPVNFVVQGQVEVIVRRTCKANFSAKTFGGAVMRAYLSGGKRATCFAGGKSIIAVCGRIDSLTIKALANDSIIDLRSFESLNSENFVATYIEERVNKRNIVLPFSFIEAALPEREETSRERYVRLSIELPDRSSLDNSTTNYCYICREEVKAPLVLFKPCNCRRVCLDCTRTIKEAKHLQFLCPYDRSPIMSLN